ncbi:MAG: CoA activase [Deltaproteobacteria bacterium]|nr:CoA activase [Deltaproteobacteria bacterium]
MGPSGQVLGIDIGSVSLGAACLAPDLSILTTFYAFHHGKIPETLNSLLAAYPLEAVAHLACTSSTPDTVGPAVRCHTEVAVIGGVSLIREKIGAILLVGGEKFSLLQFDSQGRYRRTRTNTSCAAGTGSFLDQQAFRLNLPGIEELAELAFHNRGPIPKIASRCAVFAKTDLSHAQQEGFSLAEICDGLCLGLARNIVDTLFTGGAVPGPLIMSGGVAKNRAVVRHLADLIGMPIEVDVYSHLHGAVGAAAGLIREKKFDRPLSLRHPADLLRAQTEKRTYYYPPLEVRSSRVPDFQASEEYRFRSTHSDFQPEVEVEVFEPLPPGEPIEVFLGLDIGSTSTKAVLTGTSGQVLAGFYTRTAGRPLQAVQALLEALDALARKQETAITFLGAGTTGSGRKFIGRIIGADLVIDEITAHARAAVALNPAVDTIIEIGGQDSKFTTLHNGTVTFSTMNTVCAAGTGSFIEEQASRLGCDLADYSRRAEGRPAPLASDRCTVFMERDLNHYLNKGYGVDEILAAVLHAVRDNYLSKVAVGSRLGNCLTFQGATGRNRALVAAFEQKLNRPIFVSRFCHLTGALGTAYLLSENRPVRSGFRGLELYGQTVPIATEVCEYCTNHCKIKLARLDGETVAYGFLCGRDYDTRQFVDRNRSGFDLLKERTRAFRFKPATDVPGPVIGLPAALHLFEDLPFWEQFFDQLGLKTRTGRDCRDAVSLGKARAGAEFCAPVTALHGQVSWLAERCDHIFLPTYLEQWGKSPGTIRKYCYYTQYAPALVSRLDEAIQQKCLVPLLDFKGGRFTPLRRLQQALQGIKPGLSFRMVRSAFDRAEAFIALGRQRLQEQFARQVAAPDEIGVVLLGRPYTLFSPVLNKGIPEIFGALGIKTFAQDMIPRPPEGTRRIADLLQAFHWNYAAAILEAAEAVSSREGLYPVLVTSFKCSPDSFVIDYFKRLLEKAGKPYLILQLDEHDSSVGYETRIEAAVRAFRNHRAGKIRASGRKVRETNLGLADTIGAKTLLLPNWDPICCRLVADNLVGHGFDARVLEENELLIRKSLRHNTGQCLPLHTIAQEFMDFIETHRLQPEKTLLWMGGSEISCNVRLFPYAIRSILDARGGGMEKAGVYVGNITFTELSLRLGVATYFAYMFGGFIRKIGCHLRPYERNQGETDRAVTRAVAIAGDAFRGQRDRETAARDIVRLFEEIKVDQGTQRPQVAVFGDLYTRDNEVMNQGLIRAVEEAGGEVVTTPYSDYLKLIAEPYLKRWLMERRYGEVLLNKGLLELVNRLERKYYRIFAPLLGEPIPVSPPSALPILKRFNLRVQHAGESMENLVKIFSLLTLHPRISLFVQASPAFCCPSLVTEAMGRDIERQTGIPVVSITYDGTGSPKNDAIVPYLQLSRTA